MGRARGSKVKGSGVRDEGAAGGDEVARAGGQRTEAVSNKRTETEAAGHAA